MSDKSKRNIIRPHQVHNNPIHDGTEPKGPKRCTHCHKSFQKGESWQRVTSPPDPKYGAYSFGVHATCMSKNATA